MLGHLTYTEYIFRSAYILETGQETHNEDNAQSRQCTKRMWIASDVI